METSAIKTPFPGTGLRPSFPCVPFQSSIPLSYLPSKTMGCFSGRLMSAASDQKLFCKLCSPFCCFFNEFVEEKGITPSYSSAILTPPLFIIIVLVMASCDLCDYGKKMATHSRLRWWFVFFFLALKYFKLRYGHSF